VGAFHIYAPFWSSDGCISFRPSGKARSPGAFYSFAATGAFGGKTTAGTFRNATTPWTGGISAASIEAATAESTPLETFTASPTKAAATESPAKTTATTSPKGPSFLPADQETYHCRAKDDRQKEVALIESHGLPPFFSSGVADFFTRANLIF
jgi:hypothetical protein